MEFDRKLTLKDYFSKTPIYKTDIGRYMRMSSIRFALLFGCVHLANSEASEGNNRMGEIENLQKHLVSKLQEACVPTKDLHMYRGKYDSISRVSSFPAIYTRIEPQI